jgi:succinate-acetate transporter protein
VNSKSAIITTIGYMCIALTVWMLSMHDAGWYHMYYSATVGIVFPLAFILGVMGILAFVQNRTLDAIVFLGASGYLWTRHQWIISPTNPSTSNFGWYFFVWAVFFCYVWFGAFKAGAPRFLFLLGLWLTLLGHGVGDWGVHIIGRISGYIGLVTAILAAIVSAIVVISNGSSAGGPNEDAPAATT